MEKKHKIAEQQNIPTWASSVLKGILVIILLVAFLVFITFLPDFILFMRNVLSPLSPYQLAYTTPSSINVEDYILMQLSIYGSLVAAMLAYVGYRLSKTLGKLQVGEQTTKNRLYASRVYNVVKFNLTLICNSISLCLPLNSLEFDLGNNYDEAIISLNTAGLIDKEEFNVLKQCYKHFCTIQRCKISSPDDARDSLDQFKNKYLISEFSTYECNGDVADLLKKLKQFCEEGA